MSMLETSSGPATAVREVTLAQAIREALAEEMRRDPRVFILGEDIAEAGHPFKVLTGLVEEFGPKRVLDTPISEAGFTGIAVGAAMTGLRPVVDIMFGDFIGLTMDQMVNQVGRQMEMPARDANHARGDAPICRAAFAILACLVLPCARAQGGDALHALRRERTAQIRHSRRKSSCLL